MRFQNWIGLALVIAAGAAAPAGAQVVVRLRTEHARYLLYESVRIRVRVENGTNTPLVFSGEQANATIAFEVERQPGVPARRTEDPIFQQPFEVPAYNHAVFSVDLLRLFEIGENGPLSVAVLVRQGGEDFYSGKLLLDIIPGMEIARVTAVLPEEDAGRRVFQLRTTGRGGREHLLLRVDDPDRELCQGVYDLGTMVRQRAPQLQLDARGRMHVLHQSAPTRLTQSIYFDRDRVVEATYHAVTSAIPRLVLNEQNDVTVVGVAPYTGDPVPAPFRGETAEPIQRLPAPREPRRR